MPIRKENRARYPKNWKEISLRIRFKRAKGRCECTGECGDDHNIRCTARHKYRHPDTGSTVILTVAHLDHQPENCVDENLKAMCQKCHNKLDAPMRRQGIQQRAREQRAIGDFL
jgi:hypothetical protein